MKMMKPRSFFFHFNKPRSKQLGKPQITVHFKDTCHFVDNVVCSTPTKGRVRRSQPVFVMTGKARKISIRNNIAYME